MSTFKVGRRTWRRMKKTMMLCLKLVATGQVLTLKGFPDASAALEKKNKDGETDSVRDATSESESEDSEEYEDDEDDGSSMYNESAQIYYPIPTDYNGLDSQEHEVSTTEIANVTKYPPFRFSVKFDDVTKLKVEKRVYSQTYWYAGSYWNIYIQKVQHKKGHQLGVYLHRGKLDSNTQSSNLRQDERLALFDLNEDEDGSLSIQPGSSPLNIATTVSAAGSSGAQHK